MQPQARKRGRSLRVLVIEDNPDVAANIGDYLEDRGHRVDFAMDGISGRRLKRPNSTLKDEKANHHIWGWPSLVG
jgi:CheY-like chemotaxis protein